jgi:hypothetical protein
MYRSLQASALLAIAILFNVGANCAPSTSQPIASIVGESSDAVLYTGPYPSVGFPGASASLYRMNVASGDRALLMDEIPVPAVSEGEYLAWPDVEARVMRVKNLTTGEQKEYLADVGPADFYTAEVVDIEGALMLAAYADGPGYPGLFRLVDLGTGAGRELSIRDPLKPLENSWYGGVLADNHVVFFSDALDNVDVLFLEYGARLEVVDLATDAHTVVDRALRTDASPYSAGGLVVWRQFKDGGFKSRIRSYDVQKKKISTLIEDFDNAGDSAWLMDFDGQRLLAVRQQKQQILGQFSYATGPTSLELITLNGDVTNVATAPGMMAQTEFAGARLVGHFVVWPDHESSRMVVYDVETKLTSRHAMFPD